jgi:transcription antitermination factor NusG
MGEACFNIESGMAASSAAPGLAWYAVQTGYRCEQRVALGLTNKGFETYLPLLQEVHQWNDRRKVIDVPAFSGYLFVHYEPTLRRRVQVLETSGVVRLLGGNHTPNRVPDMEIEAVRRAIGSGVDCDRCDALLPGSMVQVVRGPLAGVEGRLVRIKNRVRLVIAISVFSQAISAEVDQNDVEAIEDRSEMN